jgi:deoxyadenosine/deoxycytidine kinase
MGKIVCIDGLIGAGKSTVLSELENRGYYVFKEEVEKWGIFLDRFYKDPKRWGFTLQLAILNSMIEQYEVMQELIKSNDIVFVERAPTSSMAFGYNAYKLGYIDDEEFKIYKEIFANFIWKPDVSIFIDTPINTCMKRIKQRGRLSEKNMDISYLHDLNNSYKILEFDEKVSGFSSPYHLAEEILSKIEN